MLESKILLNTLLFSARARLLLPPAAAAAAVALSSLLTLVETIAARQ